MTRVLEPFDAGEAKAMAGHLNDLVIRHDQPLSGYSADILRNTLVMVLLTLAEQSQKPTTTNPAMPLP